MDAPSLEVRIAADAKQFPIAQILRKTPDGKKYFCKLSNGICATMDAKKVPSLDDGDVFFYADRKHEKLQVSISYKRNANETEKAAYKRFLDSKFAPYGTPDRKFCDRI